MTVKKQTTDELLGLNKFNVDEDNAHIELDREKCIICEDKPCLVVCPAKLYKLDDDGQLQFDYVGCLECGTCRIICAGKGMKKWEYPGSTFGISYRFG